MTTNQLFFTLLGIMGEAQHHLSGGGGDAFVADMENFLSTIETFSQEAKDAAREAITAELAKKAETDT